MLSAFGIGLVIAGILIAFFGDKSVGDAQSKFGKLVEWPRGRAKQMKVIIGVALIFVGVKLLSY
ncbi:MAG: hypothetical protein JO269_02035 [Burkholderiaceae bacterium]|nr:hypothetical protein [Burkholderiaceae bacterium]